MNRPIKAALVLAGAGIEAALTPEQRFLYNSSTGQLFFDGDGSNAEAAPVLIATLEWQAGVTPGPIGSSLYASA